MTLTQLHDLARRRPVTVALAGPLVIVALCLLRSPGMLVGGRFWAEESSFLDHMLRFATWAQQAGFVYRGHLELLNTIVFALASHVGLAEMPRVTTACGLLLQCVLACLIVACRGALRIGLLSALAICVLVVVSPCATENYLNMLNSVWTCSAILLVILQLPHAELARRRTLVVVSTGLLGLSGIPAACLTPLAFLHAWVWRSRMHLVIALVLTATCLAQAVLLGTHGVEGRYGTVSAWVYLAGPFFHVVVEHALGVDAASAVGHWFVNSGMNADTVPPLMLAPLGLLAWMAIAIVRAAKSMLLLTAFIYVSAFNTMFALGDRNDLFTVHDMRYFFVPTLIAALLLARAATGSGSGTPRLSAGVLLFATLVSAREFFVNPFYAPYVESQRVWARELQRCEAATSPCAIPIDPSGGTIDIPPARLARRPAG